MLPASDAVLVAVGKPFSLKAEMVKSGALVNDIGIIQVICAGGQPTIVGDVDTETSQ